jgi:hypothetical protein
MLNDKAPEAATALPNSHGILWRTAKGTSGALHRCIDALSLGQQAVPHPGTVFAE